MKKFLGKTVRIAYVTENDIYFIEEDSDFYYFFWTDEMFEGKVENIMTKSDLKSGMIVTLRNGEEYVVILNHAFYPNGVIASFAGEVKWDELDEYTDDLVCRAAVRDFDIVKIQVPKSSYIGYEKHNRTTLWEREEVKKVTIEEIEKKFGCKVEIVKE